MELVAIVRLADCYGLVEVCKTVEWEAMLRLTVGWAAALMAEGIGEEARGLERLQAASRELALARMSEFLLLKEDELVSLLADDTLVVECEERAFDAAARWMRAGTAGELRGEGLLHKIHFAAMPTEHLAETAVAVLSDAAGLPTVASTHAMRRWRAAAEGLPGGDESEVG
jgi:hypothetical protein